TGTASSAPRSRPPGGGPSSSSTASTGSAGASTGASGAGGESNDGAAGSGGIGGGGGDDASTMDAMSGDDGAFPPGATIGSCIASKWAASASISAATNPP